MGKKTSSHCCVPGCKSGYRSTNARNKSLGIKNPSLFSIKNEEELKEWSKVIPRLDKELQIGYNVCELHFTEDNIIKYLDETKLPDGTVWKLERIKPVLKRGAVPTIFPDLKKTLYKKRDKKTNRSSKRKKLSSTSNDSEFEEITLNEYPELSVTSLRDNPDHTEIAESENSTDAVLDEMAEHTEVDLDDMAEHIKVDLDEMAEHTEVDLDEMAEHTEVDLDEMAEHTEVDLDEMAEHTEVDLDEMAEHTEVDLDEMAEHTELVLDERTEHTEVVLDVKPFSFCTLVNKLECVSKPDLLWGITIHDEFVMCAKWNEDSALMKRVIIDDNLKVHVFLKNKAIDFDNVEISCTEDLSSILQEIDDYGICKNVNDPKKTRCDGYILPSSKSSFCEYCQISGIWSTSRIRRKESYWLSKGKHFSKYHSLYNKIHTLNVRNAQLKEQMTKIIKIKAVWKLTK